MQPGETQPTAHTSLLILPEEKSRTTENIASGEANTDYIWGNKAVLRSSRFQFCERTYKKFIILQFLHNSRAAVKRRRNLRLTKHAFKREI